MRFTLRDLLLDFDDDIDRVRAYAIMMVAGAAYPVTVTFTPITTATTIQPSARAVQNSKPETTPTIAIMAVDLEFAAVSGSSTEDGETLDSIQTQYPVTSQV